MQKLKSINFSKFFSILKCCLVGIVFSLIGAVVFAVVLKFTDLSSVAINYINDIIKAISIFIMVHCIKKSNDGKLIIRAVVGGVIYAILTFIIFSILNGGVSFSMSFIYDLIFAVIVSIVASIVLNLFGKKNN